MSNEGLRQKAMLGLDTLYQIYRDGAVAYDKDKKLLWNGSYDMKIQSQMYAIPMQWLLIKGTKHIYI